MKDKMNNRVPKRTISVSLSSDLVTKIHLEKDVNQSRSDFIQQLLENFFNGIKTEGK